MIYIRIQSILYRVLTLTFLYFITGFWTECSVSLMTHIGIDFDFGTSLCLFSVALRLSMYLMQDHNTDEYNAFITFLDRTRLYLCYCCCYGMVRNQHRALVRNQKNHQGEIITISGRKSTTQNVSNGKSDGDIVTGMEMSLETVTVHHVEECSD